MVPAAAGKEAVLEEHPGGRRMVDRPDKKQGRSTLFETLRWTDNAFAGGPSGTLGNAWLESYYKEGAACTWVSRGGV